MIGFCEQLVYYTDMIHSYRRETTSTDYLSVRLYVRMPVHFNRVFCQTVIIVLNARAGGGVSKIRLRCFLFK